MAFQRSNAPSSQLPLHSSCSVKELFLNVFDDNLSSLNAFSVFCWRLASYLHSISKGDNANNFHDGLQYLCSDHAIPRYWRGYGVVRRINYTSNNITTTVSGSSSNCALNDKKSLSKEPLLRPLIEECTDVSLILSRSSGDDDDDMNKDETTVKAKDAAVIFFSSVTEPAVGEHELYSTLSIEPFILGRHFSSLCCGIIQQISGKQDILNSLRTAFPSFWEALSCVFEMDNVTFRDTSTTNRRFSINSKNKSCSEADVIPILITIPIDHHALAEKYPALGAAFRWLAEITITISHATLDAELGTFTFDARKQVRISITKRSNRMIWVEPNTHQSSPLISAPFLFNLCDDSCRRLRMTCQMEVSMLGFGSLRLPAVLLLVQTTPLSRGAVTEISTTSTVKKTQFSSDDNVTHTMSTIIVEESHRDSTTTEANVMTIHVEKVVFPWWSARPLHRILGINAFLEVIRRTFALNARIMPSDEVTNDITHNRCIFFFSMKLALPIGFLYTRMTLSIISHLIKTGTYAEILSYVGYLLRTFANDVARYI